MVLQFMNKMFRYILEKKNSLLKKTVTRSPREQQGQYIRKNKNVSLTNDCYTINTINQSVYAETFCRFHTHIIIQSLVFVFFY